MRVMGTVTVTSTATLSVKAKCMSTAKTMAMATTAATAMATVTANNNCHGKRQDWAGADDKGNRQERADDDGERLGRKVRQGWTC